MEADSTLNNVLFTDVLSTGMTFVSGSVAPAFGVSCTPTCGEAAFTVSGQDVLMEFSTLANGALTPSQVTVEITVLINDIT